MGERVSPHDRRRLGLVGTAALAFITACGGNIGAAPAKIGGDSRPENSGIQLANSAGGGQGDSGGDFYLSFPWPDGETRWLINGPHDFRIDYGQVNNGLKPELDFAGKTITNCDNPNLVIFEDRVTASAAGTVSQVSKGLVEINHGNGYSSQLVHVGDVQVEKGDTVKRHQDIGADSCIAPEGGYATGPHLDFSVKKDGKPIPASEIPFEGGWRAFNDSGSRNYYGEMRQGEEIRISDHRRCGLDKNSIEICRGIRNDIANTLDQTLIEPAIEVPFVPDTPEEFARYRFANNWIDYLTGTIGRLDPEENWMTADELFSLTSGINMPENEKERMKQTLAKGERVKGPIPYYHYITDEQHVFHEGDVYVVPLQLAIVNIKDAGLTSKKFAGDGRDIGFGMKPYKGVWAGEVQFSGEISYGIVDLIIKGTVENLQSLALKESSQDGKTFLNFNFTGFGKITKFTPWELKQVSFDIITYQDGQSECRSNFEDSGMFDLANCLGRSETEGLSGIGIFDLFSMSESEVKNSEGYNGEFVIEP